MENKEVKDLSSIKQAYNSGLNITKLLKETSKKTENTIDIINLSYDLQSGSYIKFFQDNFDICTKYINCITEILKKHIINTDTIIDCGTGEMTNFAPVMDNLNFHKAYNFDLSLSRILTGLNYSENYSRRLKDKTVSFVASMDSIPLPDNSVDIAWTSHSFEPNRGKEKILVNELLRISRKKVILFEPSYERSSEICQKRMDEMGYINNLEQTIKASEGKLLSIEKIKYPVNPLNPTYAYIIEKVNTSNNFGNDSFKFTVPRTNINLDIERVDCLLSSKALIGFPKIRNIPLLKNDQAFIMTHPELLN